MVASNQRATGGRPSHFRAFGMKPTSKLVPPSERQVGYGIRLHEEQDLLQVPKLDFRNLKL